MYMHKYAYIYEKFVRIGNLPIVKNIGHLNPYIFYKTPSGIEKMYQKLNMWALE